MKTHALTGNAQPVTDAVDRAMKILNERESVEQRPARDTASRGTPGKLPRHPPPVKRFR